MGGDPKSLGPGQGHSSPWLVERTLSCLLPLCTAARAPQLQTVCSWYLSGQGIQTPFPSGVPVGSTPRSNRSPRAFFLSSFLLCPQYANLPPTQAPATFSFVCQVPGISPHPLV